MNNHQQPTITKQNDKDECLSPSELVHRHLEDKDHQISNEDLEKVALDCNDSVAAQDVDSINTKDESKDDKSDDKDILVTPLDVIAD